MTGIETMAAISALAAVAGAGASVMGGIRQNQAAKANANQMEAQADAEQAAASLEARRIREKGELVTSRQRALAAASGLGVDDPTQIKLEADTAAETELQAQQQRYLGSVRSADARAGAEATRMAGESAQTSAYLTGGSTILSGATRLYDRLNPPRVSYG